MNYENQLICNLCPIDVPWSKLCFCNQSDKDWLVCSLELPYKKLSSESHQKHASSSERNRSRNFRTVSRWRKCLLARRSCIKCESFTHSKRIWCHSELLRHCNRKYRGNQRPRSCRMEWLTSLWRWLQARQQLWLWPKLFYHLEHPWIRSCRSL